MYKGKYNRLFPSKVSSTNFLTVYTLYLLKGKSMYGKEILDHIVETLGSDTWSPSHGTLYPLLQEMCANGLIELVEEQENRKMYIITPVGIKALADQLKTVIPALESSYDFLGKVVKELYSVKKKTN